MAYLNANIPPTYAQIRKGVSYMILKNITEKLKTVLSSVLRVWVEGLYYFTLLWVTVQYFIAYQLARLFKRDLDPERVPKEDLMNLELWNCFSYYPTVTDWDILSAASGKYIGKDKNGTTVNIYLLLTLHIQMSNIMDH